MIVQPTSTNPRGPLGRSLRIGGLLLPPVLLAVIVAAGVTGAPPEPMEATAAPSEAASATVATPAPSEAGVASPPPVMTAAFPAVAAGLAVEAPADALAKLALADGRPIAVAGWLVGLRPDPACPSATGDTREILSPLCRRTIRLEEEPGRRGGVHLHVLVPPGVRLPPPLEWPGAGHADPVPAVLVGRAATPGAPCTEPGRSCDEQLTLDRVTWAGDAPFEPGVVFDAGLEVPPPAIAYRRQAEAERLAIGLTGTVLVSAVVRPSTVAALDPEAAAALARAPRPDGLVWYVRGLETIYGPARIPAGDAPPRERWVVLDETTGAPLAGGITGQAPAAVLAGSGQSAR